MGVVVKYDCTPKGLQTRDHALALFPHLTDLPQFIGKVIPVPDVQKPRDRLLWKYIQTITYPPAGQREDLIRKRAAAVADLARRRQEALAATGAEPRGAMGGSSANT